VKRLNDMTLFLDTEFNEFGGELISMALVSAYGTEFYEVLAIPEKPGDFVLEHVLPKLGREPLGQERFDNRLLAFLLDHPVVEVVADWPADFEHLCACMSRIGRRCGWSNPVEFTMRLVNAPALSPTTPHNALSDARALRDWWVSR
jgi:hypothetical protein